MKAHLAHIEAFCLAQNIKLTSLRWSVIEMLAQQVQPVSAYDLQDKLNKAEESNKHYNIMSLYRVLDFLQKNELIHKIYSNNTYSLCCHPEKKICQLFICNTCGNKKERHDVSLEERLQVLTKEDGFTITDHAIEIKGLCRDCLITHS